MLFEVEKSIAYYFNPAFTIFSFWKAKFYPEMVWVLLETFRYQKNHDVFV